MPRLGQFIPPALKDGIRIKLGKAKRFTGSDAASLAQKRLHPEARVVTAAAWLPQVFKAYYGELDPALIIPDADVAFAQSWIPFQKSGTRIFVYNFFEANYGIRDPILLRAYLLDDAEQVVSVRTWVLAGSSILNTPEVWSSLTPEAELPQEGTLVVQAFHPRIKTPARQLRFFGFYGSPGEAPTAGVHALALPDRDLLRPLPLGYRCVGASEGTSLATLTQPRISLAALSTQPLLSRYSPGTTPLSNGFLVQKSKAGQVTGIWHDGPTAHWVKKSDIPAQTGATAKTAVFVPNLRVHAPLLFVAGDQLGFPARHAVLHLFDENGAELARSEVEFSGGDHVVDTREVFASYLTEKPVSIVLDTRHDLGEFASEPTCYVHAYYRNPSGLSDQVHSYHSYGFSNAPQKRFKSFRCRKFAPYFRQPEQDVYVSVHNVGGKGANQDQVVHLRVIADSGREIRLPLEVPADRVTHFDVGRLMDENFPDAPASAVLQLEHPTTNFTGSWYYVNRKTGTLATDHFTGG